MAREYPSVLLVAPPFAGHLLPALGLGLGFQARGMPVHVVTGAPGAEMVRSVGLPVTTVFDHDPGVFDRIASTDRPVRHHPVRLLRQLQQHLAVLPQMRGELDQIIAQLQPDVVLADFAAPVAGLSAEAQGIAWVTVMPTPFAVETRTGTPAYCGGLSAPSTRWHRGRDAVARLGVRAGKRVAAVVLARQFREAGLRVYRPDGSEGFYSPRAILGLGVQELEFERDWPAEYHMIGPVTSVTPQPRVPSFFPEGKKIAVTLGTHVGWARRDALRLVVLLAERFPDYQWLVTEGRTCDPETVTTPAERVYVYSQFSYDAVLPWCDAVIHHGGLGITFSAIKAGVPAVVIPQEYDQFDVAARIQAAGIGVRCRSLKVTRRNWRVIVSAVEQVLMMDRAAVRALGGVVSRGDPVGEAVRIVRGVLGC